MKYIIQYSPSEAKLINELKDKVPVHYYQKEGFDKWIEAYIKGSVFELIEEYSEEEE